MLAFIRSFKGSRRQSNLCLAESQKDSQSPSFYLVNDPLSRMSAADEFLRLLVTPFYALHVQLRVINTCDGGRGGENGGFLQHQHLTLNFLNR